MTTRKIVSTRMSRFSVVYSEIMKKNQVIQGRWYKINKKINKKITAKYHKIKDWVMDPKGYFLIAIDKKKKIIKSWILHLQKVRE